jgi:spore coat protein U-like protein
MSRPVSRRSAIRRARACLTLAGLAVFLCPAAHALITSCTVTATAVAFGTYIPLTTATSTGTLSLSCDVVLPSSVTIALSTGASNTFAARTMSNGTSTLSYNLYTTAANNVIWGNGSGSSSTVMLMLNIGLPTTATATVYGLVPSQDPAPGSYTDTITVSVSY